MWLFVLVRHVTQHAALQHVGQDAQIIHEGNPSPLHDMPSYVLVLLAIGCLAIAAAVAGLTLGLMSLDSTSLDIVMQSADETQAEAAKKIKPVREQGNLLLVTLLLSNTLAAELLPLVLEALVPGGYFSLIVSVLSLMIFGEMIPQAVCSRHPLYIGARLIGFVKILRAIMYPVAAPIAWALDVALGEELGTIYNREELKGLIDVHAKSKVLTHDETTILKAALEFSLKTVDQISTPAENVFKLDIDTVLDRDSMLDILRSGHSRIPLYDKNPNNIVCLLLVKQLILVSPDDKIPIRAIISKRTSNHKVRVAPAFECSATVLISDLLNEFQEGRSHMAIVYDDVTKPVDDRKFMGIVSIEDIIEEILMEEIVDETDMYTDNTNQTKVLMRNSDGQMVRASGFSGQTTDIDELKDDNMRMREIDVPALRAPLSEGLLLQQNGNIRRAIALRGNLRSPSTSEPMLDHALLSDSELDKKGEWTDVETGENYNESTVLLRDSMDTITNDSEGAATKSLVNRASRLGPLLGGVPRRSMMSLLGDDDNIVPEDNIIVDNQASPRTPKIQKENTPRDNKVQMVVRPLPNDASSERAEIPSRQKAKEAKRADSTQKREKRRAYGATSPRVTRASRSNDAAQSSSSLDPSQIP